MFVPCFCYAVLRSLSSFDLAEEEEAGCFTLIVFLLLCGCSLSKTGNIFQNTNLSDLSFVCTCFVNR